MAAARTDPEKLRVLPTLLVPFRLLAFKVTAPFRITLLANVRPFASARRTPPERYTVPLPRS